jgi:hypothetical protein
VSDEVDPSSDLKCPHRLKIFVLDIDPGIEELVELGIGKERSF